MNLILYNLGNFFWFILTFFVFIIGFIFGPEIFARKKESSKDITENKLKIFGIFMGLKNYEIILFSIRTVSYIFIIYSLFTNDLSEIHFLFLFISLTIFDILSANIIALPLNILNNIFVCIMIFSKQVFWNYLEEISFVNYIFAASILLSVFIFLYTTYIYFKNVEFIINKNKFIKKVKKKKFHLKEIVDEKSN